MAIARRPLEAVKDEIQVEDVKMTDAEWNMVDPIRVPTFSFEKKGDTLIGTYQRVKTDVGDNHSNLYTITEEVTGEEYVVWGCAILDDRMAAIKPGSVVKIIYNGQEPSKKNPKRNVNLFEVYTHM